jgi:hypothetical protein
MRRTFLGVGFVKEAHYRCGWPDRDGRLHDAVGYALLRMASCQFTGVVVPSCQSIVRVDLGLDAGGKHEAPKGKPGRAPLAATRRHQPFARRRSRSTRRAP